MRTTTVVLALLGLAAPAARAQQQQYINQIRVQIDRIAAIVADSGYQPVGGLTYGTLNAGAREVRPVSLTLGTRYFIVGVCDADCNDVDLRLLNPDGSQLAQDVETDDKPILTFTAPATGQYRLMVMMAGCAQSPCYWGFQIFQKR
jgi:hypothetical protein